MASDPARVGHASACGRIYPAQAAMSRLASTKSIQFCNFLFSLHPAVTGPTQLQCFLMLPESRKLLTALLSLSAWAQQGPSIDGTKSHKQLTLEELSQIQVTSVTKDPVPAFKTPA